jgi:hypothetical protein
MASLCRLSRGDGRGRDRLLFANPDNLLRYGKEGTPGTMRDRRNLAVKLSDDEGQTWPVARVLELGTSGYSDLALGRDGTIYCLYERGSVAGKDHFATRASTLARFNLEWLTEGRDSLGGPRRWRVAPVRQSGRRPFAGRDPHATARGRVLRRQGAVTSKGGDVPTESGSAARVSLTGARRGP